MVRTRFRSAVSFCAAVVLSAGAASAGPLTEWNLIVAGDLASTSEVDGSALIGGSILSGASNYGVQGITSSTGDALLIGGNVSGGVTLNVNNGTTRLGVVNNGTINPNGGPLINDPGAAAFAAGVVSQVQGISSYLWTLAANGTLDGAGNMNATPTMIDGQLVAVYSIAATDLFGLGQLNLNVGSADSVIINVTPNANGLVSFASPPNFVGGLNQANSSRILWNMPTATDVVVNNNFNGALLALNADLRLLGGGINGSVAVGSFSRQDAEVRRHGYTGFVPTPGAAALAVMAGLVASRRRRGSM